ncbi:MAG: hypothetical protein WC254_07820 [Candidatus Woesearchaeota archaeon]
MEEKTVGGFFIGLGTLLSFTPVGLITSTWMLPIGAKLVTGNEERVGFGGSYSNDGHGFQMHLGDPHNFLRQREYYVNKEIEERNNKLQQQKIREINLNKSIKSFIIDYNFCLDQFKRKSNSYFHYTHMKVFVFSNEKIMNFKLNKFTDNFYPQIGDYVCKNNDEQIDRIYVIRRNLGVLPFNVGWLAHSGLLLRTTNGEYYICEYGVEKNKNAVSCYKINAKDIDIMANNSFTNCGKKWDKQYFGSEVKNISVG